ncbi:MAG: hypothetical protein KC423_16090, partial [Anaerolineales bacterium]|nr:hypothetical protein [Anaerolineales bacterium]
KNGRYGKDNGIFDVTNVTFGGCQDGCVIIKTHPINFGGIAVPICKGVIKTHDAGQHKEHTIQNQCSDDKIERISFIFHDLPIVAD